MLPPPSKQNSTKEFLSEVGTFLPQDRCSLADNIGEVDGLTKWTMGIGTFNSVGGKEKKKKLMEGHLPPPPTPKLCPCTTVHDIRAHKKVLITCPSIRMLNTTKNICALFFVSYYNKKNMQHTSHISGVNLVQLGLPRKSCFLQKSACPVSA